MANTKDLMEEIDSITVSTAFECSPEQCVSIIKTPTKNLNILTQNIRSINCNLSSIEVLMNRLSFDCDIVVLTECWIGDNKSFPNLPNYTSSHTRKCINKNGGVIIFVKNGIQFSIMEPDFDEADCLILKIGQSTAIVALYRSPSFANITPFLKSLDKTLSSVNTFPTVAILGDLNIDIKTHNINKNSSEYLNLVTYHGLLPAHEYPTRSDNCIDHVMLKTRCPAVTLVLQCPITDHLPILLSMESKSKTIVNNKTRKIDIDKITQVIEDTDFTNVTNSTDANTAAETLVNTLSDIVTSNTKNVLIPRRKLTIKPWITSGLLRCIRTRDRMHKKLKQKPDNLTLKTTYNRYRNFCNSLLKKLKRLYEKTELKNNANNVKKTWDILKRLTSMKQSNNDNVKLLKIYDDPQSSINYINTYFASVGKTLAEQITNSMSGTTSITNDITKLVPSANAYSFAMLPTTLDEVSAILLNLKPNCSVGWDGIPTTVLRASKNVLVPVLTYVFNLCLASATFPKVFKISIISPIHKSGDRDSIINYRPISVLPALSKILEKLINKRLTNYLDQFDLLSPRQFGFRSGKSTEDAALELTELVVKNLDNGKKSVGIFLDLAKAFDTVSVPILLRKLENLGIRGLPLQLFKDYLQDRKQRVRIGNYTSTDSPITYGVPQGSILGPSLFLIYINDLCQLSLNQGQIFTFADDTALIFTGDNWNDTLVKAEEGFRLVNYWLEENLLSLNVAKTKSIFFSISNKNSPPASLRIKAHRSCTESNALCNCVAIERASTIKYLGVNIDEHLNWCVHLNLLTRRTGKLIHLFKKLRHIAEPKLLKSLYYALCQSILSYCIVVWGGAQKTHILQLERTQRAVLKVMTFKPYRYPTFELYKDCEVLTVRQLYIQQIILTQHKRINFKVIKDKFKMKRSKHIICKKDKTNTSFSHRFIGFLGPHLYNKANKIINNLYTFSKHECKMSVKKWLQNLNYEETEETLSVIK